MKKQYNTPKVEKIVFDFRDQVVASDRVPGTPGSYNTPAETPKNGDNGPNGTNKNGKGNNVHKGGGCQR